MITHNGLGIPRDPYPWDPDTDDWVSQSWADDVAIRGAIQQSAWLLPEGWSNDGEDTDVTVKDKDGNEYEHSNRVRLTTTNTTGIHTITNRVTFADGTVLDRSRRLVVQET